MKSLLVSLLLFLLMLGGIFCNSRYLSHVADTLSSCIEDIPTYAESNASNDLDREENVKRLAALWEKNRDIISLSVTVRVTEGFEDALGTLQAALEYEEPSHFDAAREHLLRIVEDLRRYDRPGFGSIL